MINQRLILKGLISLLTLVVILATYGFYADPLFKLSNEQVSPWIQAQFPGPEPSFVWNVAAKVSLFSLESGPLVFILAH